MRSEMLIAGTHTIPAVLLVADIATRLVGGVVLSHFHRL
jgi:hypothetical protein